MNIKTTLRISSGARISKQSWTSPVLCDLWGILWAFMYSALSRYVTLCLFVSLCPYLCPSVPMSPSLPGCSDNSLALRRRTWLQPKHTPSHLKVENRWIIWRAPLPGRRKFVQGLDLGLSTENSDYSERTCAIALVDWKIWRIIGWTLIEQCVKSGWNNWSHPGWN